MVGRDYRKMAQRAARAASEKKGLDILLLDIRKESDVADFMLIVGAESSNQMRAIEDSVEQNLREAGLVPLRRDGHAKDRWVAIDYGGFLLHILLPDAREFYRLEHMWENPKQIAWEPALTPRPARRKKKRGRS